MDAAGEVGFPVPWFIRFFCRLGRRFLSAVIVRWFSFWGRLSIFFFGNDKNDYFRASE